MLCYAPDGKYMIILIYKLSWRKIQLKTVVSMGGVWGIKTFLAKFEDDKYF